MRGFVLACALLIASAASAQPATPCAANQGVWVITDSSATLWVCVSDGLSWVVPARPWGGLTGTMSDQTDLQAALDAKQASGAYATGTGTANGTNTGDQTSIVGLTGTLAQFNTALTGADFTTGGGTASGTNTGDQTSIVGITGTLAQFNTAITDADLATGGGTATGANTGDQTITLTGNVTGTGTGSFAATIANAAVTLAKMADVATATVFYRKTAATGVPEVQTLATLKTDLGLTGTNSGDQTITLTGNVTGSGTGSFAATIAAGAVTLANHANMATARVVGRTTAGAGAPEELPITGTGNVVLATTPTLTTPVIGVATGTSLAVTGVITSSGGGVGYATGAGGTVTQATNKATGVTLSKLCGDITMNAAALAAAAIVSFTLTNTFVAAADVLVLNHVTTGTRGGYGLNAQAAAGSAIIYVRNNTAGSLSEAIVVRFCVVKGALS